MWGASGPDLVRSQVSEWGKPRKEIFIAFRLGVED